jgi:hypothetical protein
MEWKAAHMIASLGIAERYSVDEPIKESAHSVAVFPTYERTWDPEVFAREQIRGLVRQVFLAKRERETRQVVFSAADDGAEISSVCRRVGETLATEFSNRVCLLDARQPEGGTNINFGRTSNDGGDTSEPAGARRTSSHQALIEIPLCLSKPADHDGHAVNFVSVQARLAQLQREFDYTIIHAPSAGSAMTAALLAHFSDGIVLVIAAHRTKRITAQKICERLKANQVRILGVVLSERTFPIPEGLYRRL